MFVLIGIIIIGIIVEMGAVAGEYFMERGKFAVLIQPAELIIIGGAAIGTILIANLLTFWTNCGWHIGVLKPSR